MKISTNYEVSQPIFQRKLTLNESRQYKETLAEGLKVLNKDLGIIVHNSCAPSESSLNTGIGSLLSLTSIKKLLPFLALNTFSAIQQEPINLRSKGNMSPYSPLATSKNILMIPLEKLASKEYAGILSNETFKSIVDNSPMDSDEKVDFEYVQNSYEKALKETYQNFKKKLSQIDTLPPEEQSIIQNLQKELDELKVKKGNSLEKIAIYEILSDEYKTPNWKSWKLVDKNLYTPRNSRQAKLTQARLNELKQNYSDEIEYSIFKQMLVEKEISSANNSYAKHGIRTIGDSPIAFTPVEEWLYKDLFLKGIALGCPPDYFSKNGQRWGFSVLNPDTIFNTDGSLGKGGELLKERYENMFSSSSGGIRIDHIIGLIDPFVYSTKSKKMTPENSGRLYSSPEHPILGKYLKNKDEEYAAILTKIIIPAAEKYGLTKEDIICEDLGTVTLPVERVMKNLGLSGISVTEFDYRGKDSGEEKVIMLGSHDNPSFIEYTNDLFSDKNSQNFKRKTCLLAQDTRGYNEPRTGYLKGIRKDKKKFMSASFTELFTSPAKRIQLFFTDFFGIAKTYNTPGKSENCWTLRLPENFEELYYSNLKNGLGMNIPEVISRAIRQKGEKFSNQHKNLLERLDTFSTILKE